MKKFAIIFPGQGSQYIGMGKKLYDNFKIATELFKEASNILDLDLKKLCFEGDINTLSMTEYAQPAILTVGFAAFNVFKQEIAAEPLFLAGHSLGEISALTASGVIDFPDAVKIVKVRSKLIQNATKDTGVMVAVMGIQADIVEDECKRNSTAENFVAVSSYNSPEQLIISGHKNAVDKILANLELRGGRFIPLNIQGICHCPLMKPVAAKLRGELQKYKYNDFKYPVLSNTDARPYSTELSIPDYLSRQLTKPVRWRESIEYIASQGVKTFIEIGPQTVLRNLLLTAEDGTEAFSFDDGRDKAYIEEILLGPDMSADIDVSRKYKLIIRCMNIAVCTENRNWNNDEFRKGVIEPYRDIQNMLEDLEKENSIPTYKQIKRTLDMLKAVFITKKTLPEEQDDRYKQVLYETGMFDLFPEYLNP